MENIARFYDFRGQVAITVGDGSTTYLTTDQAELLATNLLEVARQVKNGNHVTTVEIPADDAQVQKMRDDAPAIYKIVRHYKDGRRNPRIIKKGITIYEAQEHCADSKTSTDDYFDGYEIK